MHFGFVRRFLIDVDYIVLVLYVLYACQLKKKKLGESTFEWVLCISSCNQAMYLSLSSGFIFILFMYIVVID